MSKAIRIFSVLTGLIFSHSLLADSTVYEITKGKNKIYLAGTIHMLRAQDFPQPVEFDAAYGASQKIFFETDLQKAKEPAFGQRFAQAMMLPNNTTLKDVLDADTWAALQAFSAKSQYPLSQTMMYNPAMTSILISMTEAKKFGAGDGIDAHYDKAARADNKIISELESADDVIAYMKLFAQEDPNKVINSTLKDAENLQGYFESMIASWKSGDLDALDKEMGQKMKAETPNAYQALVVNRNKKWFPQIEQMFKTPEVEMVLVGTLHLSGSDGLLAQLKKSGYQVKPYKIKK
ncbi:MAG TPA: TraB/GumN family protein [Cellvibrio sp.]|nr:TraB/GumN family protein [Cellvibrio sp.]